MGDAAVSHYDSGCGRSLTPLDGRQKESDAENEDT